MIHQNLSQKQQLKITPEQLQLLALFHLTSQQLEMRITQELDENPTLEVKEEEQPEVQTSTDESSDFRDWEEYAYDDTPDYKLENKRHFQQEDSPQKPIVVMGDFREDLKAQLSGMSMPENVREFAVYIVESLDEKGFLETPLGVLADDYALKTMRWLEETEINQAMQAVQHLDPVGVGARSIQECMIMQLRRMNRKRPDVRVAIELLEKYYDDLKAKNFDKLEKSLNIDDVELRMVMELLAKLNLFPVHSNDSGSTETIHPDFKIEIDGNTVNVSLTRQRSATLYVSNHMKAITNEAHERNDQQTFRYLNSKLNAAEWFINAVKQRESTMMKVMNAIVGYQFDYFITGDKSMLRPMILKNIAEQIGLDISTVSRITSNKYAETPSGIILLKDLFSEGLQLESGERMSNKVVQQKLEEVIRKEDKKTPYSDQELSKLLAKNGISIARRTVTKYREVLQIPTAQIRAFWA